MMEKNEKIEYRYHVIPENISLLAFLGRKHIENAETQPDAWHYHNYLEVGYCRNGKGEIRFEKESMHFEEEMFSIIPRNCPHRTMYEKGCNGEWEYFLVDTENIINEMYKENKVLAKEVIKSIDKKIFLYKAEDYPEISGAILNICNELRKKEALYTEAVNGLLRFLLVHIVRLNENDSIVYQNKRMAMGQISRVLEYISENYQEDISTDKLAEMCHLSESHFRRVFKQIMDMSPTEYLYYVRVQMACEYMKKTDISMENVAVNCGFSSMSTFNRVFKKILNISPYQWKKNLKQKKNDQI